MIKVENYIPNILTAGNLFCGFLGILFCLQGYWALGAFMVFVGAVLDWGDGFAARLLSAYSDTGEQLDSFADMTTFAILPALVTFQMILQTHANWIYSFYVGPVPLWSLLPFLIVLAAAFRLSWFNNQAEKKPAFAGLPTPSAGLFFASLPLIIEFDIWGITDVILNPWILILLCLIIPGLMVSKMAFISIKFKNFSIKENLLQFILIGLSAVLLYLFWFAAVPMILLAYIILSILSKFTQPYEIQSEN